MAHPLASRLGRRYEPDSRDWTVDRLHARLTSYDLHIDDVIDAPLRVSIQTLTSWHDVLAFASAIWTWIKGHGKPTPPVPVPADAPAWGDPVVLDQGDYGTCVGNGWAGWGDSSPIQDSYDEKDARAIYYEATVIDGSPDNPDAPGGGQQGTTVRAGAKAMQNRGRLTAYAFATTLAQVDEWINNHGPVVIGSNWYTGMFTPDAQGFVHLTGQVEGGHCYLMIDRLDAEGAYLFRNSWGSGWGQNGNFKIKTADLARLIAEQGEACVAAEV